MSAAYIYVLLDPRNDRNTCYVGKSINPPLRLEQHIKGSPKGNTRTCRWITSLLELGLLPIQDILEYAEDWQEAERRWIDLFKKSPMDLTNHTSGGEGVHDLDAEARKNFSVAAKKRWENPDTVAKIKESWEKSGRSEKISLALSGKKKTAEHVANLPQNTKGYKPIISEESHAKRSASSTRSNKLRKERGGYKPLSDIAKQRISAALTGREGHHTPCKEETKEKISKAMMGHKKSPETIEKMQKAAKLRWEKRRLKETLQTEKENEDGSELHEEFEPSACTKED